MIGVSKSPIALRIKEARRRAGLSQAALARRLGTSTASVGLWEIGRAKPAAERLPVIADVLGVTTSWLRAETGSERDAGTPPQDEDGFSVPLEATLAREARDLGIDIPHAVGLHLRHLVKEARQRRWIEDNRAALEDANTFLERYGLWSDGKRLF